LANVTKSLLQYGVANKDILPTLQMIGDVSGGNSAKFAGLSYQFAQMIAAGRLLGTDLRSMVNNGFNPLQEISRTTGESMASLQDKMSKGSITTQMVINAFKSATSAGGKFFGGMEAGSKTLEGLTSTLKDDVAALGRSFADQFIPYIKDIVKQLSSFAQKLSNLDEGTKNFILTLGGIAIISGPVLLAIGGIIKSFLTMQTAALAAGTTIGAIAWPAVAVVAGIAAVALGFSTIKTRINEVKKEQENYNSALTNTLNLAAQQTALMDIQKKLDKAEAASKGAMSRDEAIYNKELIKELQNKKDLILLNIEEAVLAENQRLREEAAANRLKEEGENLTDDQKIREAASQAIADGFKIITEKEKAANAANEEYNATQEKTKLIREQINRLIEKGFKFEGPGIQFIINQYKDLLVVKKDIINLDAEVGGRRLKQEKQEIEESKKLQRENNLYNIQLIRQASDEKNNSFKIEKEEAKNLARETNQIRNIEYKSILDNLGNAQKVEGITLKDKLNNIDIAKYAFIDAKMNEVDAEKWATKEKMKLWIDYGNIALQILSKLISNFASIYNQDKQNQLDALEEKTNALLKANEIAYKDALKKAGVQDKTAVESAQLALDEAIKSGDAINIKKAQDALTRAKIDEEYAAKEKAIEEQAAKDANKIQVAQFKANQALNIAQTIIDTATAAMGAAKDMPGGPIIRGIAAAAVTALGLAKIAVIAREKPPQLKLAKGGIVPPQNGGVPTLLAEAGQPEVVFPLDKLESFLTKRTMNNYSDTTPINMVIKLSEREIYKGIFNATKNHTILIDATAVV
jgi:tape measure domain-containing protein